MKKILYLSLAIAAMMAVGCNKENLGQDTPNLDKVFNEDGTGFMKLQVNLPQTTSTKANDVFDDGNANEYTVENAILVLFSGAVGADEDALVLRSAYNLGQGTWNDNSSAQITIDRAITTEIQRTGVASTDELWAMVILNHHAYCEVAKSSINSGTSLFLGTGSGAVDLTGSTFKEIRQLELTLTERRFDTHSIFMTNMPYADKGGADNAPTGVTLKTLYKIDSDLISLDRFEAEQGQPAVTVNVERALAKVDVNWDESAEIKTKDGNNYKAEILGWFIDNTNPTLYAVRNVDEPATTGLVTGPYDYLQYHASGVTGDHQYRMIAKSPVYGSVYRTYWGVDPNYNTKATNLKNRGTEYLKNWAMKWNGDTKDPASGDLRMNHTAYYCSENTFDVDHQSVSQTTRVVVAAKFNDGASFYTIDVEGGKMWEKEDVEKYAISQIMQRVSVVNWLQDNFLASAYDKSAGKDGSQLFQCSIAAPVKDAGEVKVTVSCATSLSAYLKDASKENTVKEEWAELQENMDDYLATNFTFNFYKGGISYYQALIRHFDNNETPWNATTDMANTTEGVYAHNSNNYLGRYGVLRNNWYSITLEGIREIGEPLVPSVDPSKDPDTPDDEVRAFLQVKINVMPWAKRVQGVIL